MKFSFYSLLLALCLLLACGQEQEGNKPLAQVGDKQVTAANFSRRFRHFLMLTPIDEPHVRAALLQNMVDEKVLVLEAERRGLAERPDYADYVQRVQTDAVLDAYKDVIADTQGVVNEADLLTEFALENEKVHARHLFAETREQAEALHARLQAGASFEALAAESFQDRQLAASGGDLGYFALDEVDQAIKKVAATLKVGEVSAPFKSFYGYSIIKLEDRFRNPFLLETEFAKNKKRLHWEVRHQKRAEILRAHGRKILADLNIAYHPATLDLLWKELQATRNDSSEHLEPEQPVFSTLPPELPVAEVGGKTWTVKAMQAQARWTSSRQRRALRTKEALQEFLNGLVLREELLREAKGRGLERDAKVQAVVAERAEQFLINKIRAQVTDTVRVPEDSLREAYARNPQQYVHPRQVNVREITVATRAEAERLLAQIRGGADFAELAQRHSLRAWTRERGGEVGFAAQGEFGPLGQAIFALPKHGFGGPYQVGEHFMIVQVLDVRAERQKSLAEAKAEITESFIDYMKRAALKKQTQAWREDYKIEVDMNGLSRIRSPLQKS
ncbi:peptidylprolyl isomerase [candidate division KSB1 bacterium]|nr:peptidylprolyl isomerase [candidate division KSB1 bacterium]